MAFHPIWSRGAVSALGAGLLVVSLGVALPAQAAPPTSVAEAAPAGATPSGGQTLRPSSVRTIALTGVVSKLTTGPGTSSSASDSGVRSTAGFSLVGVSWDRSSAPSASFTVRTRSGGRWSGWSTLTTSDVAPDAGRQDDRTARRTTEPLWVGASDGVQVRLESAPRRLSGVQIELVDPGTNTGDAALASPPAPATGPAARTAGVSALAARAPGVAPSIISRAGWGANEGLRNYNPNCTKPEYGTTVKMGFVHHTDNVNTYSAGDVPGMLRSIYAYHVQSNRWCDIGYNFLVDRFGRIFEGRYGGTTLPVIGAHTGGFNTDTFAASMIGNFSTVAPPTATMNAMADLYAWKLGSYYRNPTGTTVLVAGVFSGSRFPVGSRPTFNTISGHRDADFTDCPGNRAYAMLPTLRTMVAERLPRSAILSRYAALGGAAGVLGEPILQGERAVPSGLMAQFQRGSISWSPATGARMLSAPFTATYLKLGGPGGVLGYPMSDDAPTANLSGRAVRLQRGFIHSSPATGVHETHGAIAQRYSQIRWELGVLGWPTRDETRLPDRVGAYNSFQAGYIHWSPTTGAHETYGPTMVRWRALGFETGVLGYPTTNPTGTPDRIGTYQHFQKGSIYWAPTTGAHEVRGAIRDKYASASWERGPLGYPTSDERTVAPDVVQTDFQHGSISWNPVTGQTIVTVTPSL